MTWRKIRNFLLGVAQFKAAGRRREIRSRGGQCPCYERTNDWKCLKRLTTIGTPPSPYVPQGTQPGFIRPVKCACGFCGKPEKQTDPWKVPEKLIFVLEWYDRESDLIKKFVLNYYDQDKTCEIIDIINNRRFIKRGFLDAVTYSELVPGNILHIYGRNMTITEYADSCTKQFLGPKQQRAFLLVRPHAVQCVGQIYEILDRQFKILRCRMAVLTRDWAIKYYQECSQVQAMGYFDNLINQVTSGPVVAFLLVGENAIERLNQLAGDKDPAVAKLKNANTLRGLYGENQFRCGVDVSENPACVARDSAFFFTDCRLVLPNLAPVALSGKDSTLAIIKPHAVRKGAAGKIMYDIVSKGFKVTAMEMFYLDRTHAEEHYEIYRGVLNEFSEMTRELSFGPCIALEVSGCGECTVKAFRQFCGPPDPVLARKLRPGSLRAKYGGSTRVKNAVHCTDLDGDGQMEVEYFFKLMQMMA